MSLIREKEKVPFLHHISWRSIGGLCIIPSMTDVRSTPQEIMLSHSKFIFRMNLTGRHNVENARFLLGADGVGGPAEQRAVVKGGDGRVGDDAVAAGGGEAALRHVDHVCCVVEGPVEGGLQRVGLHRARHFSVLVPAHGIARHLPRGAHRGVC